jgi:hypothetical protein
VSDGSGDHRAVLVVDAANVIGSRPDGWWRDRAGAARTFVERVQRAVHDASLDGPVLVVLEGRARAGAPEARRDGVEVVHAPRSGDDTIAGLARDHGDQAVVVTADRGLAERVHRTGAAVVGPRWLLDRLGD